MPEEKLLPALKDWLYQVADDKLTIGHRDSEWLGLCPDIEGDVAFSSIAQDEVGHAVFYYELLHQIGEEDADTLAYTRGIASRRNAVLLERPNDDWIYSIVRHFFYDLFDTIRTQAMIGSSFTPLDHGAQKILNEERYHVMHLTSWFTRLGMGNELSKKRMYESIQQIWPDLSDLFHCGLYESQLVNEGLIQFGSEEMKNRWINQLKPIFEECSLPWPGEIPVSTVQGRLGEHTPGLSELLSTLTEVYEIDPLATW